jgi:hypothetical protein
MQTHLALIALLTISELHYAIFPEPASASEIAIARCSATGIIAMGRGRSLSEAGAAAATNCQLKGGEPVCCSIVIDSEDAQCIALAVGRGKQGTGSGDTREEAKAEALSDCGSGCNVAAAPCK